MPDENGDYTDEELDPKLPGWWWVLMTASLGVIVWMLIHMVRS